MLEEPTNKDGSQQWRAWNSMADKLGLGMIMKETIGEMKGVG